MGSSLNYFLDVNSYAVALMQQGKSAKASHCLKLAVLRLQAQMAQTAHKTSEFLPPQDEDSAYIYGAVYSVPVISNLNASLFQDSDSIFSVYMHALDVDEDAAPELSLSTLSVILLYNLGLSLLIQAAQPKQIDKPRLESAVRLWQYTMNMIKDMWRTGTGRVGLLFPAMAIANNLGYVHSVMQDNHKTQDCMTCVVNLVRYELSTETVPEPDFQFFHNNTCMFACGFQVNTAAAA